ncbi:MAG: Mu-like prophage major head subunit gpT family protein [Pseudomonadota bacterium]
MIINSGNLNLLFQGYNAAFKKGLEGAPSHYMDIGMVVPSTTGEEVYGWLGQFPGMREWIGDRVIKNLATHGFAVTSKLFESTISVPRTKIEDDRYGVYTPMSEEMGTAAGEHPDLLMFELLAAGFTTPCFDGQPFFDADHPVGTNGGDYPVRSVSNVQAGAGEPWYLLDTSRSIRPLMWQNRLPYRLERKDQENDDNVLHRDQYLYGTRARGNAGFGLWQLAHASKAALDDTNYAAARAAMMNLKGDEGRPLNVKPDTLVVPPAHEEAALKLLNTEYKTGGESNPWKGTARLIVTSWLS